MLVVDLGGSDLERALQARSLACPRCSGPLRPWGHARSRAVRQLGRERAVQPRRSRCGACGRTHVVLPATALARRRDTVEVIGAGLSAYAAGAGYRRVAAALEVPVPTVRGWVRSAARAAPAMVAALGAGSVGHRPRRPRVRARRSAVGALVGAVEAAPGRRRGDAARWRGAAVATNGTLICNTS